MSNENEPSKIQPPPTAGQRLDAAIVQGKAVSTRAIAHGKAEYARRNAANPKFRWYAIGVGAGALLLFVIFVVSLMSGPDKPEGPAMTSSANAAAGMAVANHASGPRPSKSTSTTLSEFQLMTAIDGKRTEMSMGASVLWQDVKKEHRRQDNVVAAITLTAMASQVPVTSDLYNLLSDLHVKWNGERLPTSQERAAAKEAAEVSEKAGMAAIEARKNAVLDTHKAYLSALREASPAEQNALIDLVAAIVAGEAAAQKEQNGARASRLASEPWNALRRATQPFGEGNRIQKWVGRARSIDTYGAEFLIDSASMPGALTSPNGVGGSISFSRKDLKGPSLEDLDSNAVYAISGRVEMSNFGGTLGWTLDEVTELQKLPQATDRYKAWQAAIKQNR